MYKKIQYTELKFDEIDDETQSVRKQKNVDEHVEPNQLMCSPVSLRSLVPTSIAQRQRSAHSQFVGCESSDGSRGNRPHKKRANICGAD